MAGKLLPAGSVVLQCQGQAPCNELTLPLPSQDEHPCILQHFDTFLERVNGKRVAVFLDYDGGCCSTCCCCPAICTSSSASHACCVLLPTGTLTPIVNNPDNAVLSPQVGLLPVLQTVGCTGAVAVALACFCWPGLVRQQQHVHASIAAAS